MSLKAFHVVFIIASILLAFGFAAWAFLHWREAGQTGLLWMGAGSATAGCALLAYFAFVLRKLKHESYL